MLREKNRRAPKAQHFYAGKLGSFEFTRRERAALQQNVRWRVRPGATRRLRCARKRERQRSLWVAGMKLGMQ
jgi:hypothetical protein